MITFTKENGLGAANTKTADQIEHKNCTPDQERLQVVADALTRFNRLKAAFDSVGWNLHNLSDGAVLCVHRRWQMHRVCPDLRSAAALLRRIGGAA